MRYRRVGTTDIQVSEIGFGCWTMGGPNWSLSSGQSIGWADVDDAEILAGIKAGLDGGVNHWDNADIYGNGRAERRLGRALKTLGVRRDTQVIATKVGHFTGTAPYGYDPRHIRNQCEQSLRNLGVDHIDIYYFHHGAFTGPGYDGAPRDYLHEAAGVVHELVAEGKVRAVGQSAYSHEDFARVVPVVRPAVLQSKANLRSDEFIRDGSPLQGLMERHGCTFIAFGPLDQGILLDKFDPDHPPRFEEGDYRSGRKDFNPQTLRGIRDKLARVKARLARPGIPEVETLSSAATRWILAHPRVSSVIPGFRNDRQARANLRGSTDEPMSAEDARWLGELFAR